ncbi:MAG: hypothetical protein KME09_20330 [Pleurocapsa minor HA4230-MV1]|jgi:hypothetical protein|nr:hypothetical protein [Pleurocapsa minor HA4230-MV1]
MFNLNQVVQHKKMGKVGKVIGYGYQTFENVDFLTIKVRLLKNFSPKPVVEDMSKEWFSRQQDSEKFWQQQSSPARLAA